MHDIRKYILDDQSGARLGSIYLQDDIVYVMDSASLPIMVFQTKNVCGIATLPDGLAVAHSGHVQYFDNGIRTSLPEGFVPKLSSGEPSLIDVYIFSGDPLGLTSTLGVATETQLDTITIATLPPEHVEWQNVGPYFTSTVVIGWQLVVASLVVSFIFIIVVIGWRMRVKSRAESIKQDQNRC